MITNESARDINEVFFDIDIMSLDELANDALYFHAFWIRQKTSELGIDFEFLPEIEGKGRFLGVNMGVNADPAYANTWWGEGEVKMYIDNDREFPTVNGTGTEDYIGTAWGMGQYTNLYQGCTVANDSTKQYAFYRFHIPDIIGFHQNFRASIQQIGGGMRDAVADSLNCQKYRKELKILSRFIRGNRHISPQKPASVAGLSIVSTFSLHLCSHAKTALQISESQVSKPFFGV